MSLLLLCPQPWLCLRYLSSVYAAPAVSPLPNSEKPKFGMIQGNLDARGKYLVPGDRAQVPGILEYQVPGIPVCKGRVRKGTLQTWYVSSAFRRIRKVGSSAGMSVGRTLGTLSTPRSSSPMTRALMTDSCRALQSETLNAPVQLSAALCQLGLSA